MSASTSRVAGTLAVSALVVLFALALPLASATVVVTHFARSPAEVTEDARHVDAIETRRLKTAWEVAKKQYDDNFLKLVKKEQDAFTKAEQELARLKALEADNGPKSKKADVKLQRQRASLLPQMLPQFEERATKAEETLKKKIAQVKIDTAGKEAEVTEAKRLYDEYVVAHPLTTGLMNVLWEAAVRDTRDFQKPTTPAGKVAAALAKLHKESCAALVSTAKFATKEALNLYLKDLVSFIGTTEERQKFKAFHDKLCASFPPVADEAAAFPRVLVRGNGPAGMAAALLARKEGAKVHILSRSATYVRQHVVTTWLNARTYTKFRAEEDDYPPVGMEDLLALLGLSTTSVLRRDTLPTASGLTLELAKVVPFQLLKPSNNRGRLGLQRYIMVSDLERVLHLACEIVGVVFEYSGVRPDGGKGMSRRDIVTSANQALVAGTEFAVRQCDVSGDFVLKTRGERTAAKQLDEAKLTARLAAFDVIVGAEGAGSLTRHAYFGTQTGDIRDRVITLKDHFVPLKCPAQLARSLHFQTSMSSAGPTHGGLLTAGFVFRGDVCGQLRRVALDDGAALANTVVMPRPFLKVFNPPMHQQYCQLEVYLRNAPGFYFEKAMSSEEPTSAKHACGFNFNLQGPNKDDANRWYSKNIGLLRTILEPFVLDAGRDLANLVDLVTEFKFWDNRLRVSSTADYANAVRALAADAGESVADAPVAQVGKVIEFDDPTPLRIPRLVALVGDAVREALPDSGMGVNDGHSSAQKFAAVVRALKPLVATAVGTPTPENWQRVRTAMAAHQNTLGPIERCVSCGLMATNGGNALEGVRNGLPGGGVATTLNARLRYVAGNGVDVPALAIEGRLVAQ